MGEVEIGVGFMMFLIDLEICSVLEIGWEVVDKSVDKYVDKFEIYRRSVGQIIEKS